MPEKKKAIPVKSLADGFETGMAMGKVSVPLEWWEFEEINHSHRHEFHIFLCIETGSADIEIDFEQHRLKARTALYIRPYQVHRILNVTKATLWFLGISSENLRTDYLPLLEHTTPAQPVQFKKTPFETLTQAMTLGSKLYENNRHTLHSAVLKDSFNTIVGLMLAQYQEQQHTTNHPSRFDAITQAFKTHLERDFIQLKRPADYAEAQNITTAYLNECVKETTGFPVSYHIQQRNILEAKRLLGYTDKAVKEIAASLGYDDYAYFSRLFTKVAGMTALAFRSKNRD
jgi:AraC-like DNA-binding protein/mannose-6-phosphate isomerase-like protein (cupin superfamily)